MLLSNIYKSLAVEAGDVETLLHTVYEESTFSTLHIPYSVFEQMDRYFHWYNRPFSDVVFDHLPELTTVSILLRPQQVSRT